MKQPQKNSSAATIAFLAMFITFNVVIARLVIIPVPWTHGNVNLCDSGIFIAAFLYGRKSGAIVGSLSGFLLDMISGYSQYLLFSFIIHGLEGWIAGVIGKHAAGPSQIAAVLVAGLITVGGYYLADTILYGNWAGLAGIVPNIIQIVVNAALAIILKPFIQKHFSRKGSL